MFVDLSSRNRRVSAVYEIAASRRGITLRCRLGKLRSPSCSNRVGKLRLPSYSNRVGKLRLPSYIK